VALGLLRGNCQICTQDPAWVFSDSCHASRVLCGSPCTDSSTCGAAASPPAPIGIQACCLSPPPPPASITVDFDFQRLGATTCGPTGFLHITKALTLSLGSYVGTFTFLGDTWNVSLTPSGGFWQASFGPATTPSCGYESFAATTINASASPLGTYPDALGTGAGGCGCGTLHLYANNVVVT
jgi:hypothetical protein